MFGSLISGYRLFYLQLATLVGYGWAIVALSFICSVLMLPLMRAVAGVVRREKEYEDVIDPQVAAIKAKFSSDMDRHFHIQHLYRRYGYSPLAPIKKVLPLFVQIPFLLLTYYMLKGTTQLSGVSFLFLRDLGSPDAFFSVSVFSLNLLPVVMTGVNILTVFATLGFTYKDRRQAIGIAILFLVLLYAAPSALLLYWTLNNTITLIRTLIEKRFSGARQLGRNIVGLPRTLAELCTIEVRAWIAISLLFVSIVMRLMVFEQVWHWNCFLSEWFMCPTLAALIVVTGTLMRNEIPKAILVPVVSGAALFGMSVIVAVGISPITFRWMAVFANYVDFIVCFNIMLVVWLSLVLAPAFKAPRETFVALFRAFRSEGYMLLLILLIAIHYSYSSANFKLASGSVLTLAMYMILPTLVLIVGAVMAFGRYLDAPSVFRAVVGAAVGVYVIPMLSMEEGGILSYSNNLPVRLVVMMAMMATFSFVCRRRPILFVFISLLYVTVVLNVFIGARQLRLHNESCVPTKNITEAEAAFAGLRCIRDNNIYLLVYDSYAHDLVLDSLGIRHKNLREFLAARGFSSYSAYSQGSDTVQSMAAAFSIAGIKQGSPRSIMVGNNVLNDFLQRAGYTTAYILDAYDMPRREERAPGDFYFPVAEKVKEPADVLFHCILVGLLSQTSNTFNSYTEDDWLAVKRDKLRTMPARHGFVYVHSHLPGHCVSNPVYRRSDADEIGDYARRLQKADQEIESDVNMILSRDASAIIIVCSDHGPYLTVPPTDFGAIHLLDRCGIQLHVRWPKDYAPHLRLDCFANVFLELLICMSSDDSIARFRSDGETLHFQYPLSLPAGVVRSGVITMGKDAGNKLIHE